MRLKKLPRVLIMCFQRNSPFGDKIADDIDIPLKYKFDLKHMDKELSYEEKTGYLNEEDNC